MRRQDGVRAPASGAAPSAPPVEYRQRVARAVVRAAAERGVGDGVLMAAADITSEGLARRVAGEVPFGVDELGGIARLLGVRVASLLPAHGVQDATGVR